MRFLTIGYGGRTPEELVGQLRAHGVRAVADVRIRPERASLGAFTKARSPDRGIERLLSDSGITYHHILELGNLFLDRHDWRERYRQLLTEAGELLVSRLDELETPFCLLCAERRVQDCHRGIIADDLVSRRGWSVTHIA